jgi:hypothetical protein
MKILSRIKADGTPRYSQHWRAKQARVSRANRRNGIDGRSAEARRLRDLVEAYGEGLDAEDERIRALIRDAATAGVKIEMQGDKLAHLEFVRLCGVRRRNLEKLAAMKVRASPLPPAEIEAKAGLARLRAKLAQLAREG